MNILFLTMNVFTDIEMHNIYSDLMKEFIVNGHRPYIVTPREKKTGEKTELLNFLDYSILKVQIGNTSGVSLIEKGISTVTLRGKFYRAVKENIGQIKFDLILYSTPPITLATPVKRLKKLLRCRTYLMLKDIFPQNAVDLEMFSGKGLIYRYFRAKEKKLYQVSDKIGCMSPANAEYVLKHNPEISPERLEICPNSITPRPLKDRSASKKALRDKYGISEKAIVYLYGGNLGKPQGIPFLIECLKANINLTDRYFIICGEGSEYRILEGFFKKYNPANAKLLSFLPKEEYDMLATGCDVGMVFLDYRFTIPNFPSRILSYMENEMPVLVCSDKSTDLGKIAEEKGFGLWCESRNVSDFTEIIGQFDFESVTRMGIASRLYLEQHYTSDTVYKIIMGEN